MQHQAPRGGGCLGGRDAFSLFEEQLLQVESNALDHFLAPRPADELHGEALSYFPERPRAINLGPDALPGAHLRKARESVGIPIIGSLNGVSKGGWIRVRQGHRWNRPERDALELNVYYLPTSASIERASEVD